MLDADPPFPTRLENVGFVPAPVVSRMPAHWFPMISVERLNGRLPDISPTFGGIEI
ncbi:hypothetical protein [Novosphingobium sp. ZW T3_23]|uniref:hypothetical protein n=1 Tax=Novosphingobium sp. ZW T3_23 TaxID=3378084 RepID=UPI0038534AA5